MYGDVLEEFGWDEEEQDIPEENILFELDMFSVMALLGISNIMVIRM